MSISIVSESDQAKMKGGGHTTRLRLNAAPKTIVATARINQSSFTYPVTELTINQTQGWDKIKPGMAVWIGTEPGKYDVTAGVVRTNPTSGTLYIDAKSLGDTGYAAYIHNGISNGDYVTILKHRPAWGLLSSLRGGIMYKVWNRTYVDEGSNPYPLIRMGSHIAVEANPDGVATITIVASPRAWGAKTITSRSWLLDGGTQVGGAGDTMIAEFTPGFYVVEYYANDSGAKLAGAFRYVWVNPYDDTGEHASFGSRFKWDITRDEQPEDGRDVELTLYGDVSQDDVYPGQPFLITEEALFNGLPLSDETSRVNNFFGYTSQVTSSRQKQQRRVKIALQNPMTAARAIPAASQLLSETPSPSNWAEATSTLTNPPGGVFYILSLHAPTLLAAHDFHFVNRALLNREQSLKFEQDNIAAQIKSFNDTLPGLLGCRSDGTFMMTYSPMHMSNADRNALPTKFTWEGGDIDAEEGVDYPYVFPMRVGQVKAYAFAYDGGSESRPYASLAPGKSQGQGAGRLQKTFIVPEGTPTSEQDDLNRLSGHEFAMETAPLPEIGFGVSGNIDVCEPVDRFTWHLLNIPPELDPYGIGWEGVRAVPTRVVRRWRRRENGSFSKKIRVEFRIETFGQEGLTIPVEREGWEDWMFEGWNDQFNVQFEPKIELDLLGDGGEGSPPQPGEILVNFGVGGYNNYEQGDDCPSAPAFVTGGGNPGNCYLTQFIADQSLFNAPISPCLEVGVGIDPLRTVNSVEFDYLTTWNNFTPTGTDTEFFSSTFPATASETDSASVGALNGGWRTASFSFADQPNTQGVTVIARVFGSGASLGLVQVNIKIDNIRITYSA